MLVYDAALLAEASLGIEVKDAEDLRKMLKASPEDFKNPVVAARITPIMTVKQETKFTIEES